MSDEQIISGDRPADWVRFVGRVLIVTMIVVVLILLWYASQVILMGFAGILVAILLSTLAGWIERRTPLSYRWSLAVVVLILVLVMGLGGWLIGAQLANQFGQLGQQLSQSWGNVEQRVMQTQWGKWLAAQAQSPGQSQARTDLASRLFGALSSAVGGIVGVIVILFVGLYGAANPRWYRRGTLVLVPPRYRDRMEVVFEKTGEALRWWLLGHLATMAVVGVATGLGLWLLGIPLALSLALLAFFMEIIPNFGPVLAAVPALLIAATQGTSQLLYVLLLYVFVQGLEGYVALPLIEQRAVRLPPALTILAVVLFGWLAGLLGVLVAAPLTVTAIVLVKMLYVEDVLGDRAVRLPGD